MLPPNGKGCVQCAFGNFNSHWNSSICHTCYTENPITLECEVTNVSWNFGTFCAREELWAGFENVLATGLDPVVVLNLQLVFLWRRNPLLRLAGFWLGGLR